MRRASITEVVAKRLRRLRLDRGWSAQRLADECSRMGGLSLTRSTIAKIESGKRLSITADEVAVLSKALGVTATSLIDDTSVVVLHLSDLQFGAGQLFGGIGQVLERDGALSGLLYADLDRLAAEEGSSPQAIVVTGDVTASGRRGEFDQAQAFLTGLTAHLGLGFDRVAIVPGNHDITSSACAAYFATCEADELEPELPYWPKWRHFAPWFDGLYRDLPAVRFDAEQPWTLFVMRELRLVVAGLNSTVADSHQAEDHYGLVGESQAAWFARELRQYEEAGWLRIGAVHQHPRGRAGTDAENLRDGETLDRILGPHANLLLHGHAGDGEGVGTLASGLPTLPAGSPVPAPGAAPAQVPNRYQLVQITSEGMTRWVRRYDPAGRCWTADRPEPGRRGEPDQVTHAWLGAHATFPGAGRPSLAPLQEDPAGDRAAVFDREPDSRRLLFDRIAEVCEVRYPGAAVYRTETEPPYLRVTYTEEGFTQQLRIGACVGEVRSEDVRAFAGRVHAMDPGLQSELVFQGAAPPWSLREEALRLGVRLRSLAEFQGLLDLSEYLTGQTGRLARDPLYQPDLYVPQRFCDLTGQDRAVRGGLVEEMQRLLADDDGRFILLLGDFGCGKTFALRELARRMPAELPHLAPILIELRKLDKAHSVEGLVGAHLANHRHEQINLRAFRYMLRQGRIVLLFDGFDELATRVTYERAAEHLSTLLAAVQDKAKVVVASRTQHFQTHTQVLTALGERVGLFPQRRVLSVAGFTPDQIESYLVGRYAGDERAAASRMTLIEGVQDILGLSRNPRMLSFIADLDPDRLQAMASPSRAISAAALYEEILTAWLSYEQQRTGAVAGAPAGLSTGELWLAVTKLALRLWEADETYLVLSELTDVAAALTKLTGGHLSPAQTAHAVGAGSLLVRTEEGRFGFIHGSVMEWLVAHHIAEQLRQGSPAPAPLDRRPLSQLTVDFLVDLAGPDACQAWLEHVRADRGANDAAWRNAVSIGTRLQRLARTDLRGISLRGEDLSHRDMSEADLTGADLSHARLVDTTLAGATLRAARLVRARLDGADLTGADLTGARLMRADLRGARVTGSRWRRAALVDAALDPALQASAELLGAAVVPPRPVELELVPAAVGVSYGFDTGRLPRPIAYDADGGTLAIGSDDGGVLVCDPETGRPLRVLQGHRGRVYAVEYGEAVLASGCSDGTVRLWDPATGECRHVLGGHPGWVWPMVLSHNGLILASSASDGTVRLWDTGTGKVRHELVGHRQPVWAAAFDRSDVMLAVADSGTVRMWDTASGDCRWEHTGPDMEFNWLAFHPAGDLVAACGSEGVVYLWETATGALRHSLTGHRQPTYTLDFHPSGDYLASGDTSGAVHVWERAQGWAGRQVANHTGAVYRVVFSPDGSLLASGDSDGTIQLWRPGRAEPPREFAAHKGSVWPPEFRPDSAELATSSNDGTTRLWDTATGSCTHVIAGHGRRVTSVGFSADGSLLAACGNDGTVGLWDPRSGHRQKVLAGLADRLVSAVFSTVGSWLATANNDGAVYLWNAVTGGLERKLDVETEYVWAAEFSPDSDILATANDDDTVRLWFRTTGRLFQTLAEHRGRVRSIAFDVSGETVATGCDDRVVRLWDRRTGTCRARLHHHADRVYAVAFHPADGMLVSAGNDGVICVWDTDTGELRRILEPGIGRLWSTAFAPDGSVLAAAADLAVDLSDPTTGKHLQTLTGHTRRVNSVGFSPDGTMLASSSDDGSVKLWDMTTSPATPMSTLVGLPGGSAALSPDGRHETEGDIGGQFWHVVGMCRFEPGELDAFLPGHGDSRSVRRQEAGRPMTPLPATPASEGIRELEE